MTKSHQIRTLQESIIHCRNMYCPFRNRKGGFYPKPPRGPEDSNIMLIFENPGNPEGKNLKMEGSPECKWNIETIELDIALKLAIQGQMNWLFDNVKLSKPIWDRHGISIGSTVYSTDAHKCPNPSRSVNSGLKKAASKYCLPYLRREIDIVKPIVIISFGGFARDSLSELEGIKWSGNIKEMSIEQRIKRKGNRMYALLPHPNGLWKKPKMSKGNMDSIIDNIFEQSKKWINRF